MTSAVLLCLGKRGANPISLGARTDCWGDAGEAELPGRPPGGPRGEFPPVGGRHRGGGGEGDSLARNQEEGDGGELEEHVDEVEGRLRASEQRGVVQSTERAGATGGQDWPRGKRWKPQADIRARLDKLRVPASQKGDPVQHGAVQTEAGQQSTSSRPCAPSFHVRRRFIRQSVNNSCVMFSAAPRMHAMDLGTRPLFSNSQSVQRLPTTSTDGPRSSWTRVCLGLGQT